MIQSILIPKAHYSLAEAKKWLMKQGLKTHFGPKEVHITDEYYRFRQEEPRRDRKYKTLHFPSTPDIKMIVEYS